jgi:hypothetical protein
MATSALVMMLSRLRGSFILVGVYVTVGSCIVSSVSDVGVVSVVRSGVPKFLEWEVGRESRVEEEEESELEGEDVDAKLGREEGVLDKSGVIKCVDLEEEESVDVGIEG